MRMILPCLLDGVLSSFRSRAALQLEVIVLRHQLEVLQRTRPARVRLTRLDRILWLLIYRVWPRCLDAVVIVKPETVIGLAPQGLSYLVGLEITSTATRPPASPCRGQNIDPAHDAGESAVGRATRPWRTSQAWDRDQSGRCFQIHDPAPEAAIAELADIPSEPCGLSGVRRFFRRADRHVPALDRVHRTAPRTPSHCAFERNRAPHITMGVATGPGGVSMGDRAALSDPGSRRVLRCRFPLAASGHGDQRGSHRCQITVAERVRGKGHRNDPA